MDQSKTVPGTEATRNNQTTPTKNVLDTALAAGNFNTFAAAIRAAGLADTLAAKGPYTVFAPTDAAFKALPAGGYDTLLKDTSRLKAILNYHVISGHFMAKDIKSGDVMTLQGTTVMVTGSPSDMQVNGSRIQHADLIATNGVVHGIDAVILPKNWQLLAAAA
jgi:uncharacterized surface protein with fasciclin (FAS1) repeats